MGMIEDEGGDRKENSSLLSKLSTIRSILILIVSLFIEKKRRKDGTHGRSHINVTL